MSLKQVLNNVLSNMQASVPAETLNQVGADITALKQAGIEQKSLKVGETVTDFTLPNARGQEVQLSTLLTHGPVVIAFYRGQWCPFCSLELAALQKALPEITSLGATLVAISPQTPDNSLSTVEKNSLTFEVLSDIGNQVASTFGIVFKLPDSLVSAQESFGTHLATFNGDESNELPVPAVYVIGQDGKIVYAFVDVNFTDHAEPSDILTTLRTLKA